MLQQEDTRISSRKNITKIGVKPSLWWQLSIRVYCFFRNDTAKIGVISTPWRLVSFFDSQSPLSLKFSCDKGHVVTGRVNTVNRKFRGEYFHLLGQSMFPNSKVNLNHFGLVLLPFRNTQCFNKNLLHLQLFCHAFDVFLFMRFFFVPKRLHFDIKLYASYYSCNLKH